MSILLALGLSHQTAPLSLRDRVSFSGEKLYTALSDLSCSLKAVVRESVILSTCNRTEIYCVASSRMEHARDAVASWLAAYQDLGETAQLGPHLYALPGKDAVLHAFRLASGLDSMILGEAQILGQMKAAVRIANEVGVLGTHLHHLFQQSFATAKAVRTKTDIGSHSVTMASASVSLAKRIFEDITKTSVLVIGAGEMASITAACFRSQKPYKIAVANRNYQRGKSLAHHLNAEVQLLKNLPEYFDQFDIIVSATASPLPIIGLGMVERAIKSRRHRPIFIADLGVPRNVEPEVARLGDVFCYTVDDLGKIARVGQEHRKSVVIQAEDIISRSVSDFLRRQAVRRAAPAIRLLRSRAEILRKTELDRAKRAIANGQDPQKVLEVLSNALNQKLLHGTTLFLREAQGEPDFLQNLVDQLIPAHLISS